jgi:hypothetical protein
VTIPLAVWQSPYPATQPVEVARASFLQKDAPNGALADQMSPLDSSGLEGTLFLRMLQPLIRVADKGQENFPNMALEMTFRFDVLFQTYLSFNGVHSLPYGRADSKRTRTSRVPWLVKITRPVTFSPLRRLKSLQWIQES